jgi:MFS family permease
MASANVRSETFYGWRVVGAAFLLAVFAWGFGFYGPSIYLHEIARKTGWSVGLISSAITAHFIVSAAIIAGLGELYSRFSISSITTVGLLASAVGVPTWALAHAPWHLFVAATLTGIGWSFTSGAAIAAIVSRWFDIDRVRALSHAYNGASAGGVIMAPLWMLSIQHVGFPTAAIVLAAASLVIMLPLTWHVIAATPATRGVSIDGREFNENVDPLTVPTKMATRRTLMMSRTFASLSGAFALGIFAQMGLIAHLVTRLAPTLGDAAAAWTLSGATACAVIGRMGVGRLMGRHNRRVFGAANFAMQACGVMLLTVSKTPAVLVTGCVLFGLGIGNLLSLPPLILQSELQAGDVFPAIALSTAISQLVYAFGPATFGWIRDGTGGYAAPFALAVGLQMTAALLLLAGRPSRP